MSEVYVHEGKTNPSLRVVRLRLFKTLPCLLSPMNHASMHGNGSFEYTFEETIRFGISHGVNATF